MALRPPFLINVVKNPFVFTVQTAGADTFQLPLTVGGTYDFVVDWGDGDQDAITAYDDAAANHSYAGADTYVVTISGTIKGFRFNNGGDRTLIYDIKSWGCIEFRSLGAAFYGCSNLTISATDRLLSSSTSLENMFNNCTSLTSIPPGLFDYNASVTNLGYCFFGCTSLTSIPSGLFKNNTLATNFQFIFRNCTSLTSIPSGLFDNNVLITTFDSAFFGCTGINTDLPANLITNNVNVTTYEDMFSGCASMTGDGTDFIDDVTGSPTSTNCFNGCVSMDDYGDIPAAWGGGGP